MSQEQEYREYAFKTIELAKKQPLGPDKTRLLGLAEAWLDLAERVASGAKKGLRTLSPSPNTETRAD